MNCKRLTIITPVLNLFEFLVSTYAHATRLNEMNNLKILCFPKVTMHRQKDNFILSHFLGNGQPSEALFEKSPLFVSRLYHKKIF